MKTNRSRKTKKPKRGAMKTKTRKKSMGTAWLDVFYWGCGKATHDYFLGICSTSAVAALMRVDRVRRDVCSWVTTIWRSGGGVLQILQAARAAPAPAPPCLHRLGLDGATSMIGCAAAPRCFNGVRSHMRLVSATAGARAADDQLFASNVGGRTGCNLDTQGPVPLCTAAGPCATWPAY